MTVMQKYDVREKLGEGGMGKVYLAEQKSLSRLVAIKVLAGHLTSSREMCKRFEREMLCLARLSHPHVVKIFDYGIQKDVPYFVMEYVRGTSLDRAVRDGGPLPLDRAYRVCREIGSALAYIHGQGVIHRDLKPSNVLLSDDGPAKLMDFGLVKAFDASLTQTGRAVGTPRYLAPEVVKTGVADERSDLYQLGMVLYEAVTGHRAVTGTKRLEVIQNLLKASPVLPSHHNPAVPPALDRFLMECLARDPGDRPSSAGVFLDRLAAVERSPRGGGPPPAPLHPPLPAGRPEGDPAPPSPVGGTPTARRTLPFAAFGLLCLVLALAGILFGRDPVYDALDVRIEAGRNRARLRWASRKPYVGKVEVRPRGETGAFRELTAEAGEAGRRHDLRLDGLEEGRAYELRVIYPDGRRSLVHPFETNRLVFEAEGLRLLDGGRVELLGRSSEPARLDGRILAGGVETGRSVEERAGGRHRLVFPAGSPDAEHRIVLREADRDGGEAPLYEAVLPSLVVRVERLVAALDTDEIRRLPERLDREEAHRMASPETLGEEVRSLLHAMPHRAMFEELLPVLPGFFDDGRVALDARCAAYHALQGLVDLETYCRGRRAPPPFDAAPWFGRRFASGRPLEGPDVETLRLAVPGTDGFAYDRGLGVLASNMGLHNKLRLDFVLTGVKEVTEAAFELPFRGPLRLQKWKLSVNGRLHLSLRDHELLPYRAGREIRLHHAIEPSLLNEGANFVVLRVVALHRKLVADDVLRCAELRLKLRRGGASPQGR